MAAKHAEAEAAKHAEADKATHPNGTAVPAPEAAEASVSAEVG